MRDARLQRKDTTADEGSGLADEVHMLREISMTSSPPPAVTTFSQQQLADEGMVFPGVVHQPSPAVAQRRKRDHSALSNLSNQYYFVALAVAFALMQHPELPSSSPQAADTRSLKQESLLKWLVFAGALMGQLIMGNAIGRRRATVLSNILTALQHGQIRRPGNASMNSHG